MALKVCLQTLHVRGFVFDFFHAVSPADLVAHDRAVFPHDRFFVYGFLSFISFSAFRRLCPPNDKPPYMCVVIAPASRYVFHSFPIEETNTDKAFVHVLEGIVMAVVTEGMGMIDEVNRSVGRC